MTDPVVIVDYDPAWPARFEAEAATLEKSLGVAHSIEHIGSTAVPGLAAKPVIDLMIVVEDEALLDTSAEVEAVPGEHTPIAPAGNPAHVALVEAIVACDFTYRGVNGLPLRLYFFRHAPEHSAHVHVTPRDFWLTHDQLAFRDWLRAHAEDAWAYATLKRELATRHRDDRIAYTNAKGAFIRDVLLKAGGVGPWLREAL